MFVDQIRIYAKAGDGGKGAVSFRREKFVPKGGPDGGDGGKGGSIIFRADVHTDNLVALHYEPLIRAKTGGKGMGQKMHGKNAPDTIVPVPIGTLVYRLPPHLGPNQPRDLDDPDSEEQVAASKRAPVDLSKLELLVDLAEENQEFVLCEGGAGGNGNVHFKSSRNRVPRQFGPGEPGEEGTFLLELRKIADAGLVGYPNAGKSTLLGAISAAHPKVAAYPFTTLHPSIGVVDFPGYARATVADIPGLIEGAHRDVGLGHDFLRHIVRCKLLLFVIDMAGSEGREPTEDLARLREELSLYDHTLSERPWLVIANKMDMPGAKENLEVFARRYTNVQIVPISAQERAGIEELKSVLAQRVAHDPE